MNKILLILLLVSSQAMSDSYWYVRAGLGVNASPFVRDKDYEWEDRDSIGGMLGAGYRHRISGNLYGEFSWSHFSQPFVGPLLGLNGKDEDLSESSLDNIGYYAEYRFY